MSMVTKFIVYERGGDHLLFLAPHPKRDIEKITRKLMFSGFVRPDPAKLEGNPSHNYFPPLPPTRIP